MPKRRKKRRKHSTPAARPPHDTDMDAVEGTTYRDADEAVGAAFAAAFPNPPMGAKYRTREIELPFGGVLLEVEESVPGDKPNERRGVLIQSGEGGAQHARSSKTPPGEAWSEPDREPGSPEFDVAVTFAGEQRAYVKQVVARLRDQGVSVFYDEHAKAKLWGANLLEVFDETYRKRTHRVLMFVSEDYARKTWPTAERRFALEQAMETEGPFILPVQFDDTRVPGLPKTVGVLDARKFTAVEIADLVMDHLREHGIEVAPPPAHRDMAQRVSVRAIAGLTPDGTWEVPYVVHNGSDYPIDSVMLVINDPGREGKPEDQMGTAYELVIGAIAAGASEEGRVAPVRFEAEPVFGELTFLATVLFTDHWRNHWALTGTRLIHRRYPPRLC